MIVQDNFREQIYPGDFGVMPVEENDYMIGVISDRDIAIRAIAEGKDASYVQKTFNVTTYKGQTVPVYFEAIKGSTVATSFLIDDATVTAQYGSPSLQCKRGASAPRVFWRRR